MTVAKQHQFEVERNPGGARALPPDTCIVVKRRQLLEKRNTVKLGYAWHSVVVHIVPKRNFFRKPKTDVEHFELHMTALAATKQAFVFDFANTCKGQSISVDFDVVIQTSRVG